MNETNVENNQSNDSKKIITLVVLILTIMVCTTSATYAFFAFSASNSTTMTGTAAGSGLTLSVTQGTLGGANSGTNTNVMVPQQETALGIAMGESTPVVKAIADKVTDSNWEDGVAKALEELA